MQNDYHNQKPIYDTKFDLLLVSKLSKTYFFLNNNTQTHIVNFNKTYLFPKTIKTI